MPCGNPLIRTPYTVGEPDAKMTMGSEWYQCILMYLMKMNSALREQVKRGGWKNMGNQRGMDGTEGGKRYQYSAAAGEGNSVEARLPNFRAGCSKGRI